MAKMMTKRAFATLLLLAGAAFPSSALGKPFGLQVSPEEHHPNRKPIGVFTDGRITYSMGTYSSRLPIPLPPARAGLVPDLALEYRSDGSRTIFGVGWDVPIDHVRRSLRRGTPRYVGPSATPDDDDEFEFRLGQYTGTLIFVRDEFGFLLYRPKIEDAFAKFYYQPADGYWMVQDRSGKTWFLGDDKLTGRISTDTDCTRLPCRTFAWYAARIIDSFQNKIEYSYEKKWGNLYPKTIKYDLKENSTLSFYPQIDFIWQEIGSNNVPVDTTYRKGWRADLDGRLLTAITVRGKNETGAESVRNYAVQVQKTGNLHTFVSVWPDTLPLARFTYNEPSRGLPAGRTISVPGLDSVETRNLQVTYVQEAGGHCAHRTSSMLVDIDGDGDLDQLLYTQNAYRWRANLGWGFESTPRGIAVNCGPLPSDALRFAEVSGSYSRTKQDVLDINGDHKADLVYVDSAGDILACLGDGGGSFAPTQRWTPAGSGITSGYDLATTLTFPLSRQGKDEAGLLDVNGDGLPDYVRVGDASAGMLHAFLNQGMNASTGLPAGFEVTPRLIWTGDYNVSGYHGPALRVWDDGSMLADLRDLNGDGIIDRVTTTLQINFGAGPFGGPNGTDFWGHAVSNNAGVVQTDVPNPGGTIQTQNAGLYDIDGDGMLDLVGWQPSQGYIYRQFSGYSFGGFQSLSVNSGGLFEGLAVTKIKPLDPPNPNDRCGSGTIMLRQALLDLDGDGRVELVRGSFDYQGPGTDLSWYAATVADSAQPAHLLKQTQTGPATTQITYGYPDQVNTKSSIRNWVVKQLVEADTATNEQRTKDITTRDPVYDYLTREFRGHAFAQVSEAGGKRYQTFRYLTGPYDYGREFQHDTSNTSQVVDSPLRRVTTVWEELPAVDTPKRKWVRQKSVTTKTVDGGVAETRVEYSYSNDELERSLGLVRSIRRMGSASGPDDRIATYAYHVRNNASAAPSSSNILLVKTASETSTSGAGQQDAATSYKYDEMCTPGGSPLVIKGALCGTVVDRGTGEPPAETLTQHDGHGRLLSRTDPDGIKTSYTYHDQSGGLTSYVRTETNAAGHVVTYTSYHPFAGAAQQICGPQRLGSCEKCDGFDYDLYGRILNVRRGLESQGCSVPFLVESYRYVDSGVADLASSVTHTKIPDPLWGFTPVQEQTAYFNRWGEVVMEVKPRGRDWSVTRFTYDSLGRLETGWLPYVATSSVYSPPVRLEQSTDRYVYGHDLLDRQTSSTHYSAGGSQPGDTLLITYRGPQTDVQDEVHSLATYAHNAFDEVTGISRQVAGQTQQSSFSYDSAGRLIRAADEDGNIYQYAFYRDGHLRVAALPAGDSYTYLRSPSGRLASIIAPNSDTVGFDYDLLGRPARRTVTATGTCADQDANRVDIFSYDEHPWNIGRLTSVDSDHYFKTLDYDGIGNVTLKQFRAKGSEPEPILAVGVRPTAFGEPLLISYPSSSPTHFHYAVSGNLDRVYDEGGAFTVDVSYEAGDLPKSVTGYVEGAARTNFDRTITYDSKRRLKHIYSRVMPSGGTTWPWDIDYTYYPNNSLATAADSLRFPGTTYGYTYDEANRLSSATGYPVGPIVYSYKKNASLDKVNTNGSIEQYNYAPSISWTNYHLDNISSPSSKIALTRDASGQWCSSMKTSGGSLAYKRSYTWYGDGKLASIRTQRPLRPPPLVRYSYDENGNRWRTQRGTDDILHIDDLLELKNGQLTEYVAFPGGRVELGPQKPYRVHFNDLMNTAVVVDDGGKVVHSTSYLPYGSKVQVSGSVSDVPFDFNTKRREPTIGLLDYGPRHYDPEVRQWMAPEPLRPLGAADVLQRFNVLQPFVYAAAAPTVFAENGNEPCGPLARGGGFTPQDAQIARAVGGALIGLTYRVLPGADFLHGVLYGQTYSEWESGRPGSGRLTSGVLLAVELGGAAALGALTSRAYSAAATRNVAVATQGVEGATAARAGGGRGANHLRPDPQAHGPHSTFKTDAQGRVTGHAEWQPNAQHPSGFDQAKRVDTQYANPHTHRNKSTGQQVPTPHAHEKATQGGVRPATLDELPQ